ncbi:hypothetical protein GGI04_000585 [Coemansia thaxteri]|uniref:Subtilisin-like protein n=1 Tax=Coemansia thaxteri TaxID=2663907 RepID=A0A9W8BHJ8_9FUNG|nr:hypothetical protein H4R26_000872 [Coemansia thaxteri]KAJ2009282.1 hypothetical protein GGI04_000585 [Coemansia thaxteri]KAJ2472681.1 hypothetical protein GGI02_001417 [Coemansia sp. RSA 2322]KAJ2487151.1 hypothetical protein EV174_000693 [Coemansia sp. RSA 2320]
MILSSGLALIAVCLGTVGAQSVSLESKVVSYPPYVPVKQGAYIIELEDGSTAPSFSAFTESFKSIPNVSVSGQFDTLFNGCSVSAGSHVSAAQLARVAGVKRVWPVRYHTLPFRKSTVNITYPYLHHKTGVDRALQDLGLTGRGIKVGIVDSGVDYNHAELGNCWKTKDCPWQYGADFIGDKYDPSSLHPIVQPNPTPMDCDGHGTHVSGILAAQGPSVRGVAPGATYGMYRVFSCPINGKVSSSDEIILQGVEAAFKDGHDVISLSLGGGSWPEDPLSVACSKLAKQGVVVVAANGNDGANGLYTAGSPAVGHGVISVGSVDNWNITGSIAVISTPNGARSALMSTPGAESHPFVFGSDMPLLAPVDAAGSNTGCANFTTSLSGKVALIKRGICTFTQKAQNAQKAGAIGVIVYNNVAGMLSPSVDDSVTIPVVIIGQDDGQFAADGIAAGNSTVRAQKGEVGTFPATTGGQMSSFSSFGPSPELDIEPLVSAPGGNIWSTYPLKLGGYASLSGTSMATPYISGTVALLMQARPGLNVDEVRQILSNTAKPLADAVSGKLIHPYWSGSGLVNIYDAVMARAIASPSALSINTTDWSQAQALTRTITIRNTDNSKGVFVSLEGKAADSLSMYGTNGSLTAVPRIWPPSTAGTSPTMLPRVSTTSPYTYVPAGQSKDVLVFIIPPYGLKESERWFYGGFINLTLSWDRETAKSSLAVPFAGYNGNYRTVDVLSSPSTGLPALTDANQVVISDVSGLVVSGNSTALLLYTLDLPSRVIAATLVSSNGTTAGYLPFGYNEYTARNLPSGGNPLSGATITNIVFTDKEASQAVKVPAGRYRVQLAALRPLGDPNNSRDYQKWSSDLFSIA